MSTQKIAISIELGYKSINVINVCHQHKNTLQSMLSQLCIVQVSTMFLSFLWKPFVTATPRTPFWIIVSGNLKSDTRNDSDFKPKGRESA
jgi:hypothetical protein